jgi:hypothetical protein
MRMDLMFASNGVGVREQLAFLAETPIEEKELRNIVDAIGAE